MAVQPQRAGNRRRINAELFPPGGFIAVAMHLAMMAATERNGELVTDLAAQRAALGEAQMVSVTGVRPQTRQGCWATYLTCSRSRTRRGSGRARTFLSTPATRRRLASTRGRVASRGRDRSGFVGLLVSSAFGASATGISRAANLAWNAASTRSASSAVNWFFSARQRYAQSAASSAEPRAAISATRRPIP